MPQIPIKYWSQCTDAFVVSSVSYSKMGGRVFIYGAPLS